MRRLRCALLALLAGCGGLPDTPPRALIVEVTGEEGQPLAEVPVELDGLTVTRTSRDGRARISLGPSGAPRVRLGVLCPRDYRALEPRHVARSSRGASALLSLSFACLPKLRSLVVVARAPGGEGLTLRADGEPLGTIGPDGTLHAVLLRAPESDVRLLLETGALALSPRDPARLVRVTDRDEIVVFDQPLAPDRAATRARPSPARRAPSAPRPYPIRGSES